MRTAGINHSLHRGAVKGKTTHWTVLLEVAAFIFCWPNQALSLTFRLSDAPVDSLVRMHQTVRRWDPRALHDCEEEVQKLPVYQLQRQEGDQSVQRAPLLVGVQLPRAAFQILVTNGWVVCLLV